MVLDQRFYFTFCSRIIINRKTSYDVLPEWERLSGQRSGRPERRGDMKMGFNEFGALALKNASS
jgi:hypothetical protein